MTIFNSISLKKESMDHIKERIHDIKIEFLLNFIRKELIDPLEEPIP
jgi:hypothetical protein